MKATDYAQATGYLRVLEKKILTADGIERIIDAPDASETLKMLTQNSDFDFSTLKRSEDYEIILKSELKNTYDMVYNLSPEPEIINVMGAKYDYNNLKVALKSKYLGITSDHLYVSVTPVKPGDIVEAVNTGAENLLPEHLQKSLDKAQEVYGEEKDPQALDLVLDKDMFAQMLLSAKNTQCEFIVKYVRISIDLYNVKTLMRIKNMEKGSRFLSDSLVEGGTILLEDYLENYDKTPDMIASNFYYKYFGNLVKDSMESYERAGNFSTLEKLADNYLIQHIKSAKYVAFGPETVFAYLVARENEIRQVRLVLTCKINDIPSGSLRERLRDNYA